MSTFHSLKYQYQKYEISDKLNKSYPTVRENEVFNRNHSKNLQHHVILQYHIGDFTLNVFFK